METYQVISPKRGKKGEMILNQISFREAEVKIYSSNYFS